MASLDLNEIPQRPTAKEALRSALASLTRIAGTLLAIAIALFAGLASSRYVIDHGWFLTTETYGPWQHWIREGRTDSDPYTRAHLAKSGALRIAADSAGIYEARADSQGARLHSSCDYVLEGPDLGGLWWSLAVFDDAGELIANDAQRYAFTRDTAYLMMTISPVLMFATPVFFSHESLSPNMMLLMYLNILTGFIEIIRDLVVFGRLPNPLVVAWTTSLSVLTFWFGYWFFRRQQDGITDVI